jgi:hypothetical protein
MCRRLVVGTNGVFQVLKALESAFAGTATRFHLFGLKSQGIQHATLRPRVASCDSQAYGVAARQDAWKARASKSDRYVAAVMRRWYEEQMVVMRTPAAAIIHNDAPLSEPTSPKSLFDERLAEAYAELRALHEAGEIAWSDVSPTRAYAMAFLDD